VIVRGSNQDPSDPCLDEGELPCGQGDHGRGNPVTGSLHANCRAAQGEVDPVCTPKDIVCDPKKEDCTPTPPCDPATDESCAPPPPVCDPATDESCAPPPPITEVTPKQAPVAGACPNWIMFHSFRSGTLDVFRLDGIEGLGVEPINLSQGNSMDSRPSRSDNDEWVVFQSDRDGNVELYIADSMGNSQSRLTNSQSNNINAMFGPDNQSVLYQSDRNGNWDIFLLNKDTGAELQLTSDVADDVNPFWSPDRNWFTYQSNRSGAWNVYLFDISTGTEYQ
jgi:hypothetical protein